MSCPLVSPGVAWRPRLLVVAPPSDGEVGAARASADCRAGAEFRSATGNNEQSLSNAEDGYPRGSHDTVGLNGGPPGARTRHLGIKSPLL